VGVRSTPETPLPSAKAPESGRDGRAGCPATVEQRNGDIVALTHRLDALQEEVATLRDDPLERKCRPGISATPPPGCRARPLPSFPMLATQTLGTPGTQEKGTPMSCLSLREVTPGGWGSLSVFTHLWVLLTPPPRPLPGKTAAPGPGRGGGVKPTLQSKGIRSTQDILLGDCFLTLGNRNPPKNRKCGFLNDPR